MKINKNTHVYCTNCINGGDLISFILDGGQEPSDCKECCPWNPEDSMAYEDRPMYQEEGEIKQ